MEDIKIRSVTPEDYTEIHTLSVELGYSYPAEKIRDRIRHITETTKDLILVADIGGKAVGYIHASPYEVMYHDPIMNVLGFIVTEKMRGAGIGHLLITEMERQARERGFAGIRLTSGDYRKGAHRFYERHGYANQKTSYKFVKDFK